MTNYFTKNISLQDKNVLLCKGISDLKHIYPRGHKLIVEWLGKDFALDILAVFPLYGHFDCLFCSIIHRQVNKCPSANRNSFVDGLLKPPVVNGLLCYC